jgi:hypothetical protein
METILSGEARRVTREFDVSHRYSRLNSRKGADEMKKIMALVFLFCALACMPVPATGQNAIYNYARGVDFSFYKTYEWVDIEGAAAPDRVLDSKIKQAIDLQLTAKGFTKSTHEAQLYVAYQISFRREKQIGQYIRGGAGGHGPGWDYGYIYGDIYGGPSVSLEMNSAIQFGNLVLDIYDSAFKDLVWRGNVSKTSNPEQKGYNLNKGAAKLLKNFPPKTKN